MIDSESFFKILRIASLSRALDGWKDNSIRLVINMSCDQYDNANVSAFDPGFLGYESWTVEKVTQASCHEFVCEYGCGNNQIVVEKINETVQEVPQKTKNRLFGW